MKSFKTCSTGVTLTFVLFTYIILSCATHSPNQTRNEIPYPHPRPDSIAQPFLTSLVSTDSIDFNSAFSPDGKSFYFTRSEDSQSSIYVTQHDGRTWKSPVLAPDLETEYSEADPVFGPNGKLYFISDRPKDNADTLEDYDIWFVTPQDDGGWSEPENLEPVNSDSSEFYISFSKNGNLYFSSSRKGGFGAEDIYVSRLSNERYTAPENLGGTINSTYSEYDPCISANEDILVFTSSNRKDTFGGGDLYCSKVTGPDKWLKPVNLGKGLNTKTREYCAYFSPDSKYFFFSSQGDIKWLNSQFVKEEINRLCK
jgi:Tol biopolymer transport system component